MNTRYIAGNCSTAIDLGAKHRVRMMQTRDYSEVLWFYFF